MQMLYAVVRRAGMTVIAGLEGRGTAPAGPLGVLHQLYEGLQEGV